MFLMLRIFVNCSQTEKPVNVIDIIRRQVVLYANRLVVLRMHGCYEFIVYPVTVSQSVVSDGGSLLQKTKRYSVSSLRFFKQLCRQDECFQQSLFIENCLKSLWSSIS